MKKPCDFAVTGFKEHGAFTLRLGITYGVTHSKMNSIANKAMPPKISSSTVVL